MQLAKQILPIQQQIRDAVTECYNIGSQSFKDQWRQLVLRPLSQLDGSDTYPSYVVVIDAVDECEDEDHVQIILQLLAEVQFLKKFGAIPEFAYRSLILHNVEAVIVDQDISNFLRDQLRTIGEKRTLEAGWPDEQTVSHLVSNASGLFIWAATACRYISEGRGYAAGRVSMILDHSASGSAPEDRLDEIYLTVLKTSIHEEYLQQEKQDMYSLRRRVLGAIVVLYSQLSVKSLRVLLPKVNIGRALGDLHAILDIPQDMNWPLRLHHPSFRDFLINKERCTDLNFWVDEQHAHQNMVTNCLQLMSTSLRQDIWGMDGPEVLTTDVESSRLEKRLSVEVQYACLYWVEHLQRGGAWLYGQVYQFLQDHLLHWLEALGWMGKTSDGVLAIISLEALVPADENPNLHAFVHDAKRFALYNRWMIKETPLQVYSSALIFAPEKSHVRRIFEQRIPHWIRKISKGEENWSNLLQAFEAHKYSVHAIAFSPVGGKQLASGGSDNMVRLWHAATGTALQTLAGHGETVEAVAFSPDGKQLASASSDKTVRLWDAAMGVILKTLYGHTRPVVAVAFSPNGKQLASASWDSTIRLWDAATGLELRILKCNASSFQTVAFSPDGRQLASASSDRTVRLWDAATGVVLKTLYGHTSPVAAVAFSPDGKQLASASWDSTIRLWDIVIGVALKILEGHTDSVDSIAFSPNGKQLASASSDSTVRLWDSVVGVALKTLEGHTNAVAAVAFSPNGEQLASGSLDGTVRLWESATYPAVQMPGGHTSSVTGIVLSPNGKQLASASKDMTIRLWEAATGATLRVFTGHTDLITELKFSPDSQYLASFSFSGTDLTVGLWGTATETASKMLMGHTNSVSAISFSPNSEQLVSASKYGALLLWDVATGSALKEFENATAGDFVEFSPSGGQLASFSTSEPERTVWLWNLATGALTTLEGHTNSITAVAFSPNGKKLASASGDNTIRLWDTETGRELQKLEGHTDPVGVAFSPDGVRLASVGLKSVRLRLWDLELESWDAGTQEALRPPGIGYLIRTLSFSEDGSYLNTDRGPLPVLSPSRHKYPPESSLSPGIFLYEEWMARGKENMLWIPADYRSARAAIRGKTVALGHSSGYVLILEFGF